MVACSITGVIVFLEIQQGKEGMNWSGTIWSWAPQPPVPRYWWRRRRGWGRGPWKFQQGVFTVRKLVLVEESSIGSCLHWCWFDWYGKNQHQKILRGYDRGVNEGLAWYILHSVWEKAYGARVKTATFYWLQVQLTEGPIICCYSGGR